MARGKRTDPTVAVLVTVMADMGFESGLIAEIVNLPRGTVNDIAQGNGPWIQFPETELFNATKLRVMAAIDRVTDDLALMAMARLEEKIKSASLMESLNIVEALMRKGGLIDEQR